VESFSRIPINFLCKHVLLIADANDACGQELQTVLKKKRDVKLFFIGKLWAFQFLFLWSADMECIEFTTRVRTHTTLKFGRRIVDASHWILN
jgi:hypothetical protein